MSLETVIGLEVHAELKTKTKIFCSCSTEFGKEPNHNTCPICLGLPGTLPVLNEEVVALAIKAGKAFHCDINKVNKMDRKNYFYPDLPKAYQISQFDLPLCSNGYVEIEIEGKTKKIRLNHIHIEEDAGKLVHDDTENASYIDYNRVGVPLIEMVSEPDLRSPDEAVAYFKAIKSILEYSDISDCRMDQGSLRCDANISIREAGSDKLNTKVEMKNIGSFKELEKALKREEKRQRELYSYGEEYKIKQETRRWDSGKGRTVSMRTKEDAHDYRYFPEPDLVPIIIEDKQIKDIESSLPEMPKEKKLRFIENYKLPEKEVSILLDTKALAILFEDTIKCGASPKSVSNWILGDLLRVSKENSFDISKHKLKFSPKDLADLIKIIDDGKINKTAGKEVFEEMFTKGSSPHDIIEQKGLSQISDTSALEKMISEILEQNPKSIEDFASGKPKAAGFLMGQIMKASNGQANPKIAKELLTNQLNNRIQ
ncbi:MAG: Asp-tRNA(Asn)/Glu-tRNA(Gln) amidotransferase subunit GatB [Clostridium sp.]|uniref:Asp-tRNA(Asn)/Glu-tRNA(Gln) amidotransferase subunit GatB n=1 Tax=Clostridium sp. DSM 8431 TaxID=1761781 RepID=UPI0008E3FDD4|nr:Asp-tRNA(Asn)/Glu-tRNA(Gln) amidotransferase subunit GatB [Clostridium sp. DSM 8431]MCR4944695.1 Asp-tRNA(Asn)/Glu-tRNA(Gln) amidotransferase subunit GatB [Clostridium sp.]SFU65067.1 aspartyl/glutamyl-tRNA(Asn/Gln) amidotransferase subunit B [Clostridium sp. DSM 8431]